MGFNNDNSEVGFNSAFATAMRIDAWCRFYEVCILKGDWVGSRNYLNICINSSNFIFDEDEETDIDKSMSDVNKIWNANMKHGELRLTQEESVKLYTELMKTYRLVRKALYKHKLIMTGDKNAKKAMF